MELDFCLNYDNNLTVDVLFLLQHLDFETICPKNANSIDIFKRN